MKCSECGKEICVLSPKTYKYKYHNPVYRVGKGVDTTNFQCSYTCYDHAVLRSSRERSYLPDNAYRDLVLKCEQNMRNQGKQILEPIKIPEKRKKTSNVKKK